MTHHKVIIAFEDGTVETQLLAVPENWRYTTACIKFGTKLNLSGKRVRSISNADGTYRWIGNGG